MKVLVFGTFDGIHDGHRAMLSQAKKQGSYVLAVVAKDEVVKLLKGSEPKHSVGKRIQFLKDERLVDSIIPSDHSLNTWKVIHQNKPDIIALGYDQDELKSSLETYLEGRYPDIETEEGWKPHPKKPTIVVLNAYKPETHHNSLL